MRSEAGAVVARTCGPGRRDWRGGPRAASSRAAAGTVAGRRPALAKLVGGLLGVAAGPRLRLKPPQLAYLRGLYARCALPPTPLRALYSGRSTPALSASRLKRAPRPACPRGLYARSARAPVVSPAFSSDAPPAVTTGDCPSETRVKCRNRRRTGLPTRVYARRRRFYARPRARLGTSTRTVRGVAQASRVTGRGRPGLQTRAAALGG